MNQSERPVDPGTPAGSPPSPMSAPVTAQTAWVGWVVFGAAMMILLGTFQIMAGLVALLRSDYYLVGRTGLLVDLDFTVWGWTHLALGVVIVAAGVGVLAGRTWARAVGILLAMLSAVANLAFLAAYPLWGIITITLDVVVIYALAVHGPEIKNR